MAINDVTASLQPARGGLAAMLGFKPNPVTDYLGDNRSALLGLAAGLAGGPTWGQGISSGFQMAAQGSQMDQQKAEKLKADAKASQQTTATRDLFAKNAPDLLPLLDSGAPMNELFDEYIKRQQPGYGQMDPTANMRDYQFAQDNPGYADFLNPPKAGSLPTSYQEYQLAQSDPVYAAQLNSSTSRPLTEGQRRNQQLGSVVEPLVSTVVDNWAELTDPKNQSVGFDTPLGAPGFALTSPGYQKATNALKTIAQSYLYSVSGAAATDTETKKIVDSVTPKFGESEASANDKKALLARYVKAILDAGGGAPGAAPSAPAATGDPSVDAILQQYGVP